MEMTNGEVHSLGFGRKAGTSVRGGVSRNAKRARLSAFLCRGAETCDGRNTDPSLLFTRSGLGSLIDSSTCIRRSIVKPPIVSKPGIISDSVSVVGQLFQPLCLKMKRVCQLYELAHPILMSMMQQSRGLLEVGSGEKISK